MYVGCRHRPVSSRAQRRIRFRRRSGGLQTGQRDGRERPWCPVSPAFRGGLLFANPELSKGPAFRRRSPASTLAYLGQTLVQILPLAQDEYINAYDTDTWRETIRTSHSASESQDSRYTGRVAKRYRDEFLVTGIEARKRGGGLDASVSAGSML